MHRHSMIFLSQLRIFCLWFMRHNIAIRKFQKRQTRGHLRRSVIINVTSKLVWWNQSRYKVNSFQLQRSLDLKYPRDFDTSAGLPSTRYSTTIYLSRYNGTHWSHGLYTNCLHVFVDRTETETVRFLRSSYCKLPRPQLDIISKDQSSI